MVLYFGAALPDGVESGDEQSELATWLSRADLVWLDLAEGDDGERVTRWAQRTLAARRPLLVIGSGDAEGLATMRREQVSWLARLDGGHDWLRCYGECYGPTGGAALGEALPTPDQEWARHSGSTPKQGLALAAV